MRGAVYALAALWLAGAGMAQAQDFPDGTFASDAESCDKLVTKTPAELGDDFDFQVLSKKGLVAFQQICDFVNVVPHDATSWVATAFCDEAGYTYPDLFSVKQKEDGKLNVTRITDLTQENSAQDSAASDGPETSEEPTEDNPSGGEESAGEGGAQNSPSSDEQEAEAYSTFVKCQTVKP